MNPKNEKPNKNPTRRNILSFIPPIALGGLTGAAVFQKFLKPQPDLRFGELLKNDVLKQISSFKASFLRDKGFLNRANTKVVNDKEGRTRRDYAQSYFLNSVPKHMPRSVQAKLGIIIPGLIAQETRYDGSVVSPAGAKGLVQAMPSLIKDMNNLQDKRKQERYNIERMSEMSHSMSFLFDTLDVVFYKQIGQPSKNLAIEYGLNNEQAENFSIYCILNAYNTGPTRMRSLLEAFKKVYPPHLVQGKFTFGGLSLFSAVASWGQHSRAISGYRQHSSEYVLKVLAGAEALGYENLDRQIIARDIGVPLMDAFKDIFKISAVGAGTALTTDVFLRNKGISRRNFFPLAAGGAVAALGSNQIYENQDNISKLKRYAWWQK